MDHRLERRGDQQELAEAFKSPMGYSMPRDFMKAAGKVIMLDPMD